MYKYCILSIVDIQYAYQQLCYLVLEDVCYTSNSYDIIVHQFYILANKILTNWNSSSMHFYCFITATCNCFSFYHSYVHLSVSPQRVLVLSFHLGFFFNFFSKINAITTKTIKLSYTLGIGRQKPLYSCNFHPKKWV